MKPEALQPVPKVREPSGTALRLGKIALAMYIGQDFLCKKTWKTTTCCNVIPDVMDTAVATAVEMSMVLNPIYYLCPIFVAR